MNAVKGQYKEAFLFFRTKLWKPALVCAVLFFAAIAGTVVILSKRPDVVHQLMEIVSHIFSMKALQVDGKLSAMGILTNNLRTSGLLVLLGLIPFLFLPILGLVENACVIGIIMAGTALKGASLEALAAGLIPHGIFELPALILSTGMGSLLCMEVIRTLLRRKREKNFLQTLSEICRFFLLIVLPLLVVAAVIETYVSPVAMNYFL